MDYTFPVPPSPLPNPFISPRPPPAPHNNNAATDSPFMSNMEEISYWITTKQAPCLFNYDNVIKKQCEEAHCSNVFKPKSVQSLVLDTSPIKKKKRKLSLLDDESVSSDKHQNVYFETSKNKNQQIILDSCNSDTLGSDLEFNIKSPCKRNKSKRVKLNKCSRTKIHKKNKIATSTPKVGGNLRRSLRKSQKNTNSHLNDSFEVFNCEIINSNNTKYSNILSRKERSLNRCKKAPELASGDQGTHKQISNEICDKKPVKINNGEFDDMSDVSGFTANYIRSTKLHSSKKIRNNVRRKGSRTFMKQSQQSAKKDDNTMIVCLNKSVNTGMPKTPLMNCSTDSSQNVLNLVTLKSNDKSARISRSTSLLKFMDTTNGNKKAGNDKGLSSNKINVSFNSKSSITTRYPIRHKNSVIEGISPIKYEKKCQPIDRLQNNKNTNELHNSDRKENPVDKLMSRTRSGKCIGLMLRQPENSVLVLSNTMDQVSSLASINVATPSNDQARGRSKRRSCTATKPVVSAKKQDISERRESLREKSGFAACFSDSDEDNGLIRHKKFFC